MKKYIPVFLLGLSFTLKSIAQNSDSVANYDSIYNNKNLIGDDDNVFPIQGDTVLKRFAIEAPYDSMKVYLSRKDFRYMRYLDSLLRKTDLNAADTINSDDIKDEKKSRRITVNAAPQEADSIFDRLFVKIFFWMIAIGFICFIVYKLLLTDSFFKRNLREHITSAQQANEPIITSSEYDHLIGDAVMNKNYPLAVRYLYLQTLQKLSSKKLINFSPDKTNYEYVKELSGKAHQNQFASLTLNYEYAWYGKFNINEDMFLRIQKEFNQYHQQLNN